MKITVLYFPDDICMLYTMYPLLRSRMVSLFDFTTDMDYALKSKNRIIFVIRFFRRNLDTSSTARYFCRLKESYDKVIYFEDTPDPRRIMTDVIDYVDLYYKKSVLRDKSLYKRQFYSETLYGDYYHRKFGVKDDSPTVSVPLTDEQISKIRLAWNIGIGQYPKTRLRRAVCRRIIKREMVHLLIPFLGYPNDQLKSKEKQNKKCPLRFRTWDEYNTLSFQRLYFLEIAKKREDLFSWGKIPLAEYNRELMQSKLSFASFGQGEICFRDFESILYRSLMLKPDMNHLETWPDVYIKEKTYIPLAWDGSDFIEKVEEWQAADTGKITEEAIQIYLNEFSRYTERLEMILNDVFNL